MTIKELYLNIEGDYEQAVRVLRIDKLIDKHIRKFPDSGVTGAVITAGKTMDANKLFESAHAMKGVCSNLGLVRLAGYASIIAEEFRPENERKLSDTEVAGIIAEIEKLYSKTAEEIRKYEERGI